MATYSAISGGGRPTTRRGKRASKPRYDPLYARAKDMADHLWEKAVYLASTLAPDVPADAEQIPEWDQWQILEATAGVFSETYWDDPDALEDLHRFRQQFLKRDDEYLKVLAKRAKAAKAALPDVSISPANPQFEKMARKVGG